MSRFLFALLFMCCATPASFAEVLHHLPLDDDSVKSLGKGEAKFVKESPAKYVYDPLTKSSRVNLGSRRFDGDAKSGAYLELPFDPKKMTGSFTVEMFVKFDEEPKHTMFAVSKSRKTDTTAEWAIGARYLNQFHQTYFGASVTPPKSPRKEWSTGHYVTLSRITKESLQWRHIALVYDADRKVMTCFTDYWCHQEQALDAALTFDDGALHIGGSPDGRHFNGHIDEVRFVNEKLSPAQFLRARNDELKNVDFTSPETVLPRGTGYVDVRECFGAVGDGKTDDTEAFQKAFHDLTSKVPGGYYTLYVPPGKYLISEMLWCSRFIIVQGAGADRTTFQLKDHATKFNDPKNPLPVIRASSYPGAPGTNGGVNGSSIGLYFFDLTIDTGKGNPGAKGIEYHSNNHGSMVNVHIRSGDGAGVVGLDLTHKTNGPALIQNVRIAGFDYSITAKYAEYSLTFEHLTLIGSRKAGILNEGNILAMRDLTIESKGPAIISKGGFSMITLIDAKLSGSADVNGLEVDGGVYLRNIHIEGYRDAGEIPEKVSEQPLTLHDAPKQSLNLVVEEPPMIAWGDIHKDWVSVFQFQSHKKDNDWGPAIQAAIDGGAKTIYFPWGGYEIATPVHLKGSTVRLFGMRSHLHRSKSLGKEEPILIYDSDSSKALVIERLEIDGLHHASSGTLVLRHSTPNRYTTSKGCGKLHMFDVSGTDYHFDHPQQVWVRQWNPEAHGEGPNIISKGASIWSLGFKTEYESSKLWASDGASTEILGGFIYPVNQGIPKDRPMFKNINSRMSLIYGMSVYVAGHDLQVYDQQGDVITEVRGKQGKWVGPRMRMDLFRSERKK